MCALHNQPLTKPQSPTTKPNQSWNVSRRNRMLRSLHNRINSIRATIQKQALEAARKASARSATTSLKRGFSSHNDQDDCEYLPGRSKRTRVTYTKRSQPAAVPLLLETPQRPRPDAQNGHDGASRPQRINFHAPVTPGRIPLQTPVVRKIREFDTPNRPPPPRFNPKTPKGRFVSCTADIKSIRLRLDGPLFCEYEFLLRAIEIITAQACPPKTRNLSNSLLGMCMRNVTGIIAGLEEQRAEQEEGSKSIIDESNISAEMYTHLEAMNPYGPGWMPLCLVVLREATEMLRDAIAEGLILEPFTQLLLQKFAPPELLSEATLLLQTIVDVHYDSPADQDARIPSPIGILYDFCKCNNRRDLLFQILEPLLFSSQLPTEWLSTSAFSPIWSEAIAALGNPAPCRPVMDFVGMALFHLSRVAGYCSAPAPKSTSSRLGPLAHTAGKTLASVLGILVGLALVAQKEIDGCITSSSVTRRIVFLFTHCIVYTKNLLRRTYSRDHVSLFSIATFLAGYTSSDLSCRSWPEIMALTGTNLASSVTAGLGDAVYSMVISMVCTAAHGCSVGSSEAPHQYLVSLCAAISSITVCGRSLADGLQDGSRLLSNLTGDLRDIAFAETQEALRDKESAYLKQPGKSAGRRAAVGSGMYSGYQWDEALSEWVECKDSRYRQQPRTVKMKSLSTTEEQSGQDDGRVTRQRSVQKSIQATSQETSPLPRRLRSRGGLSRSQSGLLESHNSLQGQSNLSRITVEIPVSVIKGKFVTQSLGRTRSKMTLQKRLRDYSSDGEYREESDTDRGFAVDTYSEDDWEREYVEGADDEDVRATDYEYQSGEDNAQEYQSEEDEEEEEEEGGYQSEGDDENQYASGPEAADDEDQYTSGPDAADEPDLQHDTGDDHSAVSYDEDNDEDNDDDELSEALFSFSGPPSRQPTPLSAVSTLAAGKRAVKSLPVRQVLSRVSGKRRAVTLTTMGGAWNEGSSDDDLL